MTNFSDLPSYLITDNYKWSVFFVWDKLTTVTLPCVLICKMRSNSDHINENCCDYVTKNEK